MYSFMLKASLAGFRFDYLLKIYQFEDVSRNHVVNNFHLLYYSCCHEFPVELLRIENS